LVRTPIIRSTVRVSCTGNKVIGGGFYNVHNRLGMEGSQARIAAQVGPSRVSAHRPGDPIISR
jgi:hypothetical protein